MKILSSAPSRISLFGGGTDLPAYAEKYGGIVISMSINIRQHITMRSGMDMYEIPDHLFPYRADPYFYYKILEEFGINDGSHSTRLVNQFDGLIESGLGSSASCAIALIGAINKRLDLHMSLEDIAEKAWDLEVNKCGLFGGKQDQYAAAFGGINVMDFSDKVTIMPFVKGALDTILPSMVLLYTGFHRESTTIQEGFKKIDASQLDKLHKIKNIALNAIDPLIAGNYKEVGKLLNKSWILKRESNKGVSNTKIDDIYRNGIKNGAYGGKILGSGGGGFMLFIIDPEKREQFIKNMELEHWDFTVDYQGLDVRDITGK